MAGSQNIGEGSDNPVAINITAMVDVIFCLCLFFMCSFHFKQLQGKIETWLPKGSSLAHSAIDNKVELEEIRIVLSWDDGAAATQRRLGNNPPAASDEGLMKSVLEMCGHYHKLGRSDFPVLIEPARDVPWEEIVHVMDLLKKERLERIEFASSGAAKKTPGSS